MRAVKSPITRTDWCPKSWKCLSFFKTTEFKENGFSIEIEMVAKFLKFSSQINEVPISYYGRSYREGKKIKSIDGIFYLLNTLKYKFF